MRKLFIIIILANAFQHSYAQKSSRVNVSFNYNWEIYRTDSVHESRNTAKIRSGTSFASQFNQESVQSVPTSPESIRSAEVSEAQRGFNLEYPKISDRKWQSISLPHPARYENELNPGDYQFTGICYFRKRFSVPASYNDNHVVLQFEGAMQAASIWINGQYVMQHEGGYLPFDVPLDGRLKPGEQNEIIIRLDNLDNKNVPPGRPLNELGFLYWSGIYRDVWLIATNKIYITNPITANTVAGGGVFAIPENISSASSDVLVKTQIKNSSSYKNAQIIVKQRLSSLHFKAQNFEISLNVTIGADSTKNVCQKISLLNPNLWSPDAPNLYVLTTEIWFGGKLIDNYTQNIGIRKLSFSRSEGFKLNDKPIRIVGTNRHQDFPYVGNALSDAMQYRDLKRIKEAGFNFVRLSHYPQAPSVYKFCDSIGLMVEDPIPGWQFFNNNEIFKQRVFSDIRQMIRRDRNHPSIVLWEVSLNETYPTDSFRVASAKIAHEEYPGNNFFTCGDTYAAKKTAWDVPFNNWIDPFGRPQDVQPNEPGFVREYGDYEFGGQLSTTRANRTNGEKALLQSAWNFQWEHNLLRGPKFYPWTIGDATWAFFDGFEAFTKGTTNWGAMDVFRIPKFSYYFFKSQLDPYEYAFATESKPMVYIANWWTKKNNPEKLTVYSNCEEVALYINGKFLKKQFPDSGPDSDYGDFEKGGLPFDGGNSRNLKHPPFTFENINWQAGEIKAVGLINGRNVVTQTVKTPLRAIKLKLSADDMQMPLKANGSDAILIHAQIIDANGTIICLDNRSRVTFEVSGKGKIIGPKTLTVQGGIASVLIGGTNSAGKINIAASCNKIKKGVISIHSY